jgi:hypothetical protein
MPTSRSPRRAAKGAPPPPPPPRSLWPAVALIAALAALAVTVVVLPASLAARFLPAIVHAEDFSGTLWHGSAAHITANGRDAGAIEWRLHPSALLKLRLAADLHWVKGGFVLDTSADIGRNDILASDVHGGGPIADLKDFGVASGWRGLATIKIPKLAVDLSATGAAPRAAEGEIDVANASSPQIAGGADLGSYALTFNDPALSADSEAGAMLADTGGPLQLNASLTLTPKTRTGLLSGTVKERDDAPLALRRELDNIAQVRARDAQGRIPIELEFTF